MEGIRGKVTSIVDSRGSCSVLLDRIQYLSLYLHCFFYHFGYVVRAPSPFVLGLLLGSLPHFCL
jgi:hypothetical protein